MHRCWVYLPFSLGGWRADYAGGEGVEPATDHEAVVEEVTSVAPSSVREVGGGPAAFSTVDIEYLGWFSTASTAANKYGFTSWKYSITLDNITDQHQGILSIKFKMTWYEKLIT